MKNYQIIIIIVAVFLLYKYFTQCGKEGHFSHSSGGGVFSWEAIKIGSNLPMQNRYLFVMFESYIDGTSDHYVVDIINLPTMDSDSITASGKPEILQINNNSISKPDAIAMVTIKNAKETFFNMLTCNDSDNRTGKGTQ